MIVRDCISVEEAKKLLHTSKYGMGEIYRILLVIKNKKMYTVMLTRYGNREEQIKEAYKMLEEADMIFEYGFRG